MTQAPPTIGANKSGIEYRNEDNDGKKALLNHHKGATAPSYAEAGIVWLDDAATPWKFKVYDGADWITLGEVHAANNTFKPYIGAAQAVTDFTEASIAAAATTDLGSLSGNAAEVTGTTAITSFGSSASTSRPVYFVRFSGALTLTHNATSLILPGGANITTAAGDAAVFKYEGSGNWRCMGFLPAAGLIRPDLNQTFTKAQRGAPVQLAQAATIAVDLALGNHFYTTMTGNRTLGQPTNMTAGQSGTIQITQDATGNRTLAYHADWLFPGGSDPVLSTAANAVDLLCYQVNQAGTKVFATLQKGFA